jgi:hypothetical protein
MSLESIGEQCAVGPDGRLKEPWEIEFRHDPDDPHPLPRVAPPAAPPLSVQPEGGRAQQEGMYFDL